MIGQFFRRYGRVWRVADFDGRYYKMELLGGASGYVSPDFLIREIKGGRTTWSDKASWEGGVK